MIRFTGSICTRCGKPRIALKTFQEKIVNSFVFYTLTTCSDLGCQKIVNSKLKIEKEKRMFIKGEQIKREAARKKTREMNRRRDS